MTDTQDQSPESRLTATDTTDTTPLPFDSEFSAFGSDGFAQVPKIWRNLECERHPVLVEIPRTDWQAAIAAGLNTSIRELIPQLGDRPLVKAALELQKIYLYRLPLRHNFRGLWERNGLLLLGEHGWSEFAPFWSYEPPESVRWFRSGLLGASTPGPRPLRTEIPVNVTIPVVSPERAQELVYASGGCLTAKIKVAKDLDSHLEDVARVAAVQEALTRVAKESGSAREPRIRIDVNANWSLEQARRRLPDLNRAANGLEYAEQPCWDPRELVKLRADGICPIAADEAIRRSPNPLRDLPEGAADVIVIKVQPLGGVQAAVQIAKDAAERGVQTVFSSALDSAIGIYQGLQAAAAVPGQTLACGLASGQLFQADVTECRPQVRDGKLSLAVAPEPRPADQLGVDSTGLAEQSGAGAGYRKNATLELDGAKTAALQAAWLWRVTQIMPYL